MCLDEVQSLIKGNSYARVNADEPSRRAEELPRDPSVIAWRFNLAPHDSVIVQIPIFVGIDNKNSPSVSARPDCVPGHCARLKQPACSLFQGNFVNMTTSDF